MIGLQYTHLKSAVKKTPELSRVLFYKATGYKNAKCAKGADGVYNAVDTTTGKFLGFIDVNSYNTAWIPNLGADITTLNDTLTREYLRTGGKQVKLPHVKEYSKVYKINAEEGKNLDSQEQEMFARNVLSFLQNISDKFKRPIVIQPRNVPDSIVVGAIESKNYVAIPTRDNSIYARVENASKRAIDGIEMDDRCYYLKSTKKGFENRYNEQTYKNINKYLENNDIDSLVYAEYAVHPEVKKLT